MWKYIKLDKIIPSSIWQNKPIKNKPKIISGMRVKKNIKLQSHLRQTIKQCHSKTKFKLSGVNLHLEEEMGSDLFAIRRGINNLAIIFSWKYAYLFHTWNLKQS